MIEVDKALQWINRVTPSAISEANQYWIGRISDGSIPDTERLEIILNLKKFVEQLANPLEQAEILSFCGAYGYLLKQYETAVECLQKAADLYEYCDDNHRQATVLWMYFIVLRGLGKYRLAFDQARRSRRLFIMQAENCLVKNRTADESWYRGRILDMTCDLVSSPEDMFECLFEFNGSNLSPSALEIKNRVASELEQLDLNDFKKTKEDIRLFLAVIKHSVSPQEVAEALAYSGVVSWVLEEKEHAINYFRSAMTQYLPSSFEYAVLQWMLGLAWFVFPKDYSRAINAMEASIVAFDSLRLKAIHQNNQSQADWFTIHHSAMKRILRTRVEST